jgi:hypothetical protein
VDDPAPLEEDVPAHAARNYAKAMATVEPTIVTDEIGDFPFGGPGARGRAVRAPAIPRRRGIIGGHSISRGGCISQGGLRHVHRAPGGSQ